MCRKNVRTKQVLVILEDVEKLGLIMTWSPRWTLSNLVVSLSQLLLHSFLYPERPYMIELRVESHMAQNLEFLQLLPPLKIEEESLISYLIYMANCGFPLTRTMVKAFAWSIAKRCGTCDRFNTEYGPGEKWWTLFKQRHPQLALLCFRSDSDSDNNDGSICTICGCKEPEGLWDEIVFWIDCSICGEWAHNLCAFGKNSNTRQYVCINCWKSLNRSFFLLFLLFLTGFWLFFHFKHWSFFLSFLFIFNWFLAFFSCLCIEICYKLYRW